MADQPPPPVPPWTPERVVSPALAVRLIESQFPALAPASAVRSLEFDTSGRSLLTGDLRGEARLWDLRSGKVQAQYSEAYTFYTFSDEPVRLWVNGQQIINNWQDHVFGEDAGVGARSAVGHNVLPGNIPVEVECIFEVMT